MSAETVWIGSRLILWRPAVCAVLAGLGMLVLAPQGALAESQGASWISVGSNVACAIESGKAYCWGDVGPSGNLGDGGTVGSGIPVAVDTSGVLAGKILTQVSVGSAATCALDSTGAAYCWGDNFTGDLGDGSTTSSNVPVAVDTSGVLAGKTLTQISVGDSQACALDSVGAAYCWGGLQFADGGLGNGGGGSDVPVAVDVSGALAGKTLTRVSAGNGLTCALGSAGAAYCWGSNGEGALGDGTKAGGSGVPVAVDVSGALAGKTLIQVSAGGLGACALDSTGAAYCWGTNSAGELGDGSTTSSDVPVAVGASGVLAGKTLTQISASGNATVCALDSTGAAYCWGGNSDGELGDGTAINSSIPVAVYIRGVLAGKTLIQISAGSDFDTCALNTDGAMYCWGSDRAGVLGDDSPGGRSLVPVLTGPQAPTHADVVADGTTATVYWTAPDSLDGATLTGYTATASPGGMACTTTGARTCDITGLTGLSTETPHYRVTVMAHTTAGDSGASTPAILTAQAAGPIVSGQRVTKCVDDNGDSAANNTRIVMWDCADTVEQTWEVGAGGTIRIHDKCLDIYRDEKANKAPVELWDCTGGPNQKWESVNGALVNPASGRCLDDPRFNTTDGTQLEIYTCDGGHNQQWQLP